jgi:uncharacterized protein YndB with AHSA1/START domain
VAPAEWLHLHCASHGPDSRRLPQNVLSEFTTGRSHSFNGQYVELVLNERLQYTDRFEDQNLPGEIRVTVTLKKVSVGTDVSIVQEGLPDVIPFEACYLGWQESLGNLAKLIEPEITQ